MKTILLAQGLAVGDVYSVMSAGDSGEKGDLAICRTVNDQLIEVVVKDGQIHQIFDGWRG